MRVLLIDASLVATALLEENKKVEKLFKELLVWAEKKKILLISSKFLSLEVANALRFTIKDKDKCLQIMKDFSVLPIRTFVLSKVHLQLSIKTSFELGTTVYDTSYHIMAKAYGATFITCDEEYFNKAELLGDIEFANKTSKLI